VNNLTITFQRPGGDPPMTAIFSDEKLMTAEVTTGKGGHTNLTSIVK
jgi:hypothetical protein